MNAILRQLFSNALHYMIHDDEKRYLVETFGCRKTTVGLCQQLRQYKNDVAPAPRIEDFIRYHYRPCDPECEYYLSYENALDALLHTVREMGEIVTCKKLYTIVMIQAVEGRYPSEMELMLYDLSSSIDHSIHQFQFNVQHQFAANVNAHAHFHAEHEQEQKSATVIPESYLLQKNMEQACCMCQEALSMHQRVITLPCMHTFHTSFHNETGECVGIEKWLVTSTLCPLCKRSVS